MSDRVVVGTDVNGLPKTVAKPQQTGDCVILHLLDENNLPVVVAAPMAKLYHFAFFREETEMHIADVSYEVFDAFLMFLYDKSQPQTLELFSESYLHKHIPGLITFIMEKITRSEFISERIYELYEFALFVLEESAKDTSQDTVVIYNDSIIYEVATKCDVPAERLRKEREIVSSWFEISTGPASQMFIQLAIQSC